MSDYIKLFDNKTQQDTFLESEGYTQPHVSCTKDGRNLTYNKYSKEEYEEYEERKLLNTPLTFNILTGGTITWKHSGADPITTIQYKKNDAEWTSITSSNNEVINVVSGDVIQFRGDNSAYSANASFSIPKNYFGGTSSFNAKGNIMSLISSESFSTLTSFASTNVFSYLFENCTGLISAEKLCMPVLTMTQYCYRNMFNGCTNLTSPPQLPATTLANYCYQNMFQDCTSLITAPELLSTSLANYCYSTMFKNCTSLETAPDLPAITLGKYCYSNLFSGCTSLTSAPELPATTLADYCYQYMFEGCTNLTTAPELPATTLVTSCYRYMFQNCTNINYIKAMFTTTPSTSYTNSWVSGVAETGTFVKNASATWTTTGVSGIPTGWTVETAT